MCSAEGTWSKNAVCFDLNAACTGFMVAYNTAQVYIEAGLYKNILIIGAESLSTIIDPTDRGTCILFGDGAGAAVVQAKEGKMIPPIMHSDGVKGEVLYCETGGFLKMDGQEVFKFAVKRVPECINDLLAANDLTIDDIDYFVLHQANKRIIEAAAKRLRAPIEKFPMNMEEYGNTSSASIPILLDEMKQKGMLKAGQKIVMAGFGAGLSWGASLLEW